ncbi:MAG: hypothetical protein GWP14_02825 [Actinobacteria bacterium]|nr:hypothetical protein [Actinomycetota bacterium]
MKRLRSKTFIVWIGLAAYLLPVLGATGDAMLCYGADGHVAREPAQTGSCGLSSQSPPQAERSLGIRLLATNNHCSPCVDVPILLGSLDGLVSAKVKPARQQATAFTVLPITALSFAEIATENRLPVSSLAVSSTFTSLRSVIFLI